MPSRAAERAALAALALAACAVWLSLPDKTFVFDGVVFAQVVERSIDEWRREMLNPRHLFFNPFFQILRDGLTRARVPVGAYRLFQVVNALAGGLGLVLFGDLARRMSRDAAIGWCAALLLGATWGYGTRATEGQVYMLMSVGAIAVLWASIRLLERPSMRRASALALAAALAPLFHLADVFLWPAAAAAFWLAFPDRRGRAVAGAAALVALAAAPFLLIFGGVGLRGFLDAGGFQSAGGGAWAGLFSKLAVGVSPISRIVLVWRETGQSLTPMSEGAGVVAGLSLWLAASASVRGAWPQLDGARRSAAIVAALVWAGFTAVNAFWPGGPFFYVPAHACALALISLEGGRRAAALAAPARRRAIGALAAAGLAFAAWNVRGGLIPQSRIENNAGYRRAMFVGRHTEPSSYIVISGLGFSNSKAYLANFAHRTREVLEYYFDRAPKDEALKRLAEFRDRVTAHGIPIYLLSDLVESPGAAAQMKSLWGVDIAEVQQAFGPGRVVRMAASPEERVYLLVPYSRQSELFVVLGYSALTEADESRLSETVVALKEIAREMTPADRRRAAGLMRTKNWGFDMLWEGFAPLMSPESRAAAQERAKNFAAYQKTPDFWLRAGNLYRMLGLNAETIDAWSRAQKMSGDRRLLQDIEILRRGR